MGRWGRRAVAAAALSLAVIGTARADLVSGVEAKKVAKGESAAEKPEIVCLEDCFSALVCWG